MVTTVTVTATVTNTYVPYRLNVHSGGHYLVRGTTPFLMIGDSPQGMLACLTPAQMHTYLANRQGYGINYIQVHLLAGSSFGGNSTTFEAKDGTHAFTSDGDISTPNANYFAQVDAMLDECACHGMTVCLTAAETIDGTTLWKTNGTTKCTNFGAYLGARYKDFPNIIWNYGNDCTPELDEDLDDCLYAVCDGIKSEDSVHLHTYWPFFNAYARYFVGWNGRVDLDLSYTYCVPYGYIRISYALSPAKPVHMGEAQYEAELESTPLRIRRQAYMTMLAGACGYVYCCGPYTYKFDSGWDSNLDSYPGLTHVSRMKTLLSSYAWYNLLFDSSHDWLTSGYGTYDGDADIDTNDFAPCAYLADGSLALIYMPTNRTMTVDMSEFSGTVTCRWFDPTSGDYETDAASPHANSGTHDFSHAGANDASDPDWVLVLEA